MAFQQSIFRTRRNYNQWVNNQTLEDYALRFTAVGSRRWSLSRVAHTALGAISFLALEAIGGAITLSFGFTNAISAIVVVSLLIFMAAIPICYYAARYGVDIDLLTRGAGFGYLGSTATSLIYASFTFIFFALEAAIMAKALELVTGLPLAWGYVLSSAVVLPMVFHGFSFINRFQHWTQPLWLLMQIVPLVFVLWDQGDALGDWVLFPGAHQQSEDSFDLLLFGAACSVMFALVAQIGEQVDFLRFLPERTPANRRRWWTAMLLGGPGWIIIGAAKLSVGSFLAYIAFADGYSVAEAADPTVMYTIAYLHVFDSGQIALWVAAVFVVISQLKINVTNAYAGSIAWSNFFSRLTHSHPGRVVWLVFNVVIALLLMELGVYQTFEKTLSMYALVAVAWVGTLVADLVINKPLKLSPPDIEFKRAYLHDLNPVGMLSMIGSCLIGFAAYLGFFNETCQALAHFIVLLSTFVLCPAMALLTRGRYYIARRDQHMPHPSHLQCIICENNFEKPDMAFCPAYGGTICSLCCSLDSRCQDACKTVQHLSERLLRLLPTRAQLYINIRLLHFVSILLVIAGVTAILLSLIHTSSLTGQPDIDGIIASALWKVFFILLIVAGIIAWLFILAHESRTVAQQESQHQNTLLMQEINAHQQTDAALQLAKDHAEAANNAKSRYLTGLSHELRTPLNSILGYAQLLDSNPAVTGACRRQLQVIRRGAEHLTDLIEGLLDISKIEAGRLEIISQPFELVGLMKQLVDMFQLQAHKKGLTFSCSSFSTLPEIVQGDERRVRQIMINLLSNAVKYTERGTIELNVRYRNQVAEISVRDTGIGIPENEMERIFKPFERLRLPNVPAVPGTGLGLTITRLLVEIMGGDIEVKRNKDCGVTFKVTLMLASVFQPRLIPPKRLPVLGYEGQRRTLLVVDDDPTHRGLLQELLVPLGFPVIEAPSAAVCLEIVHEFSPDAFIIDRRMPGMEGPELARQLRRRGFRQPIIIVSANASEDESNSVEAVRYHDGYLIKPIRLDNILDQLAYHLDLTWCHCAAEQISTPTPTADSTRLVDELAYWAELGALEKVRKIFSEIERRRLVDESALRRLRARIELVDLAQITQILKVPAP